MPGDLNLKKSWNPALMKNQKKVWEREQEALKEYQTTKQRAKEIAQEREKEEMIRLQYANSPESMPAKHRLELNKLGWMYNEGPKGPRDDPDNEQEHANGFREVQEDFLAKSDDVEQLLKGNRAIKPTVASRFDKVASVGNQAPGRTLSDDPMLAIRREQRKQMFESRASLTQEKSSDRRSGKDDRRHRKERSSSDGKDRDKRSRDERDSRESHRHHRKHRDDERRHRDDDRSHRDDHKRHRDERHRSHGSSGRDENREKRHKPQPAAT